MASEQTAEAKKHDPQTDFDFLIGAWKVHNRKLKERLKGSKSWEEFDGTVVARQVWGGNANIDEYEADSPSGHIQGLTLRLYNPKNTAVEPQLVEQRERHTGYADDRWIQRWPRRIL